ncbi:ABC transporter permease [Paenibacillus koleovorans]|uniref:ABC transporter permease n=1 Tax=Paenibacillus koleovorans TaxID=121608 RepID=UPI001FE9BA12|nr:ABC transporter permease subunit [Paenibacillus koleovorans]
MGKKTRGLPAINLSRNVQLFLLASPVMLFLIIFHYLPMAGVIVAFKKYRYDKGIFGSDWAGLDNFKFFFKSNDAWMVTFNTIAYNAAFIVLGILISIGIALLMNEIRNKSAMKVYQTAMFFPHFLSWVIVAYITYAFLSPSYGLMNQWLLAMDMKKINWYFTPDVWPYIIISAGIWKSVGVSILINYAVLVGVDQSYYESAAIDGASKWQMARFISIPFLIPVTMIQFILQIGHIFHSDFGLFYQVPQNSAILYSTTSVIDTYVFRALTQLNQIGMGAAVGLFQAVVGFIIVITANAIVRKIRSDSSLF